tara:strand:- start:896 stop:1321 length:426 start_codon:yes stop_codon:yes gene_type:complete
MFNIYLKKLYKNCPEFEGSNWLIRIPLIMVFIQQGFDKLPFDQSTADAYGLPTLIWFSVILFELIAGFGLLFGGMLRSLGFFVLLGDILTRFSGIIMVSIITGVIVVSKPESFFEIILYDHFHVILYCGGLFFALRGNRVK